MICKSGELVVKDLETFDKFSEIKSPLVEAKGILQG